MENEMKAQGDGSFLAQLARHYAAGGRETGRLCFVFPNRRSIVFFTKKLSEAMAGRGAFVSPQMLTINDFFIRAAGLRPADRIGQLLDLYACYKRLYPKAESLDEFIYWGDVILGDFNDVDKYLVDPESIFTNISDLKAIQDDYSHLTATQRTAIKRFLSHFDERDRRVSANLEAGRGRDVKGTFREIWDLLLPLYVDFNSRLAAKGEAYEGAIYRHLAQTVREQPAVDLMSAAFPHAETFVFAGLNALNECEKSVLKKMKEAGIAEFCWDYCGQMIRDPHNRASLFMEENLKLFPSPLPSEVFYDKVPEVTVVSVPSAVGQVKLVSDIVKGEKPDDCAVVLPDESLLIPLLNSLDPEITDINVTMGYPLQASELHALMQAVSVMQLHRRIRDGKCSFWWKPVNDVFANGVFRKATADSAAVAEMIKKVKGEASYYIPAEQLAVDPLTSLMFKYIDCDFGAAGAQVPIIYSRWQKELISMIGSSLSRTSALELDLAKEYWCCVNRIGGLAEKHGADFNVTLRTYVSLLDSLLAGVSVPFKGEPLKGMQIMGPLETRALDFKNVVLLSCNEGVFPGRQSSNSFIPAELRHGFGLPTPDYKDAMWAYYFYRMISRARNVWLIYDSRTDVSNSGGESRFIKQLHYHFNMNIQWKTASAGASSPSAEPLIPKTQADVDFIREHCILSPSSLNNYIDCPARFYYSKVKGLKPEDEISENLDASTIGTVYHNVMRDLYMGEDEMLSFREFDKLDRDNRTVGREYVDTEYLRGWLKRDRDDDLRRKVDFYICKELHTDEVCGRNLITATIICKYIRKTVERDIELLDNKSITRFHIVGLEYPLRAEYGGFRFMGSADRIDFMEGLGIRMVDYKTGSDDPGQLAVDVKKADVLAENIFDGHYKERKKIKALLQFYLYGRMLGDSSLKEELKDRQLLNSMYSVPSMFRQQLDNKAFPEEFVSAMDRGLERILDEIADVDKPFVRTDDEDICKYCDFKTICGK